MFIRYLTLLFIFTNALSVSADDKTQELSPLIVSATRWESAGIPTASNISVITREEITNSGARSVSELLRARGGVQVNDQYGDGSRVSISMRGFGANAQSNSLILVDGRRLNNTDLAAPLLTTISIKDIEQIEIIKGSAAVLFGDQAVGGVINIITSKPEKFNVNLNAGMSSYATQTHELGIEHVFDNGFSIRGSYQRLAGDNYRDNNEKQYHNLFAYLDYEWTHGLAFIEFQDISEDINLPGAIFADQVAVDRKQTRFPLDFNSTDAQIGRIGGRYNLFDNWHFAAEFTNRRSTIEGILTNINFEQQRHNRSFNPRLKGSIPFNNNELDLVVGLDWEDVDYGIVSPFGVTDSQQKVRSVYLQSIIPVTDDIDLIAGARHAYYRNKILLDFSFPDGMTFSDNQFVPSFGIAYQLNRHFRLNLKYEENYRFPLIDEETSVPINVTGLETQTGESYEASIDFQNRTINASIVLYRLDLENEIDFDPVAPIGFGFTGANNNLDKTRRNGLIFEGATQINEMLNANFQYSYVDAEFNSGVFAGNLIPFVAKHQLRLSLDLSPTNKLHIVPEIVLVDERVASGDYANSVAVLPGYGVMNLAINHEISGFTLSARVNNLLGKKYSDFAATAFNPFPTVETGFYPAPERNFFLTIGYNFN